MHAEKLGSEIKKIRVMRGLTQKQLSDNICHQSEVSRIESGAVYPSMDILQGIAAKLQVPIIHFMRYSFIPILKEKNSLKIKSLCFVSKKDIKKFIIKCGMS